MTAQVEIINVISEIAGIEKIGSLSPDANYAITFAGGREKKRYRNGDAEVIMNLQLAGRDRDQKALVEKLCGICDRLTRMRPREFPKCEEWEIRGITVGTPPSPKGITTDDVWTFVCILSVVYDFKPNKN